MESKLIQIRNAYNVYTSSTLAVDKSNIQWKTVEDVCKNLSINANILDAGCGDGRYIVGVSELGFHNVIGVDLFEKIHDQSLRYQKEDINHLSFKDQTFDFIYGISVINYTDNYEQTLKEWYRVLKPGGYIMLSGHTKYSIFTLIRLFKKAFFSKHFQHLKNIHFHNPKRIAFTSEKIGFRRLKQSGFFISWLDRFTKRKMVSLFFDRLLSSNIKFNFGYHFVLVLIK